MNEHFDMEIMSHEQAVQTQAVERYLLGELDEKERDSFEAHYFDCQTCYDQVGITQDFMGHARQVLSEEAAPSPEVVAVLEPRISWLAAILGDFRRPAMAFVTAMLLCAVGIGVYQQNLISSLKAPKLEARYTLRGESKGSEQVISVSRNTTLSLRVDFLRDAKFVSYKAQIVSAAGKVKPSVAVPQNQTDDSVAITLPADSLDAGSYQLIVYGVTEDRQQIEAGHGGFELQFTN